MDELFTITAGGITTLLVEGIKWVVRKIAKNDDLNLPVLFYVAGVPVINALMPFFLFWLGVIDSTPLMSMAVVDLIKFVVLVALASLVSYFGYENAIYPLKSYAKALKAE